MVGENLTFCILGTATYAGGFKSKGLGFRLHSYGRRFGFDIFYTAISGCSLRETTVATSPAFLDFRADLYSGKILLLGYFNMNPSKFSLRAITLQNE